MASLDGSTNGAGLVAGDNRTQAGPDDGETQHSGDGGIQKHIK